FYLDPGVHLHKIEFLIFFQKELDGARVDVTRGLRRPHRSVAHLFAEFVGNGNAGRFLDHLLMVPLNGTVSLSQMDHVAETVGHDLKFNMSGMADKMFDVHGPVAESHLSLFLRGLKTFSEVFRGVGHTHSLAASAQSRL